MREVLIKAIPFDDLKITELEGVQQVNEHGELVFSGLMRGEKESEYISWALKKNPLVSVNVCSDSGEEKILFQGVLVDFEIQAQNDVRYLTGVLRTNTYLLDLIPHSIDRQLLQPSVCQFLKPEVSSLEVRINKEVRDYQESLFFGLTLRQFIFALLAVAVAVGIYFGLRPVLGSEVGWVCILAAFPFALGGFFQYNSMTFEQFILAVIRSELLYPKRLVFKSDHLYAKALDNSTLKEAVKLD